MKKRFIALLIIGSFLVVGCSGFMKGLRRSAYEDENYTPPTVGGAWPEGRLLDTGDGEYGGRYLASEGGRYEEGASWVDSRRQEMELRGRKMNQLSYSDAQNMSPNVKRAYRERVTKEDFVDSAQNEGSLWASKGQTNYYFVKNKIKEVGDLLTLDAEESLVKDVAMEIRRTLTPEEREVELEVAQKEIEKKAMGKGVDKLKSSAAAAATGKGDKEKDEEVEIRDATDSDIDLTESVDFKVGSQIMIEISQRYPNGNYKVRGEKRIRYRMKERKLFFIGIVRSQDIDENQHIASGKIYEYKLNVLR